MSSVPPGISTSPDPKASASQNLPFHFSIKDPSDIQDDAPDKEAKIGRNPHGNWDEVEASRPDYNPNDSWLPTKTPAPQWKPGMGATSDEWKEHKLLSIDPNEEGRANVQNYKLMISTTVPRPIAFVSTVDKSGLGNLAPFSYFNCVSTDVRAAQKIPEA